MYYAGILAAIHIIVGRPITPALRPRFVLELALIAALGVIGSFVGGTTGTLLAAASQLPAFILLAITRRMHRAERAADAATLADAIRVRERLMWPLRNTADSIDARRRLHNLQGTLPAFATWLRAVPTRRRTPAVDLLLAEHDGDRDRMIALTRHCLTTPQPLDLQALAVDAGSRVDLPWMLHWYESEAAQRVRRRSPATGLSILRAAGRTAAVMEMASRMGFDETDLQLLHLQLDLAAGVPADMTHPVLSTPRGAALVHRMATLPIAPQALTEQEVHVVDRIEAETFNSLRAFGQDTGTWRPVLTWILCAILVVRFLIQVSDRDMSSSGLYRDGGFLTGDDQHFAWSRAFTAVYVHGNLTHLAFNVGALAIFGRLTEARFRRWQYVVLWLVASTGSFVVLGIVHGDRLELTVGASGGVLGLIGAGLAVAVAMQRSAPSATARRLIRVLGLLVVLQLTVDLFVPNVSQVGHLAGLVIGYVLGSFMARAHVASTA